MLLELFGRAGPASGRKSVAPEGPLDAPKAAWSVGSTPAPDVKKPASTGVEDGMLKAIKNRQAEGTTEYVRDLLARCESGAVVAVSVVEELGDGTYRYGGGGSPSRHMTAGILLDLAIERLQRE
jgi:hypothetical protein